MIDRTTKLRLRRTIRHSRQQVEDIGQQAEDQLDRHLFRRVGKLVEVRTFVVSWLLLIILLMWGVIIQTRALGQYYTTLQPVAGATFTEGLEGSFGDVNPVYASGLVDTSVSRLLFASLFKIDEHGSLVGDLAQSWSSDARGVQYTITLRNNLRWQDGQPLTADDVLFTYQTIQNPDAQSPLFNSWQGIKITTVGTRTVIFTLPNALSSFPYSLTTGIIPRHILGTVPATELRSARFNTTNPIGAGPFRWNQIEVSGDTPQTREEKIGLRPFADYYGGAPKLNEFIIRSFNDSSQLISSFQKGELTAMVSPENLPSSIQNDANLTIYNVPVAGEVDVFFKTSSPTLQDSRVRQALVLATNEADIERGFAFPVAAANSPLLKGQVGYDKSLVQLGFDPAAANHLLDQAGWVKGADGIRTKGGQPLSFTLVAEDSNDFERVTKQLQQDWHSIGVELQLSLQDSSDLQGTVDRHDYDALLQAIEIGQDPDVFVYWDSSQASPQSPNRLNFSEYRSAAADAALEAGRSRSDPTIRAIKYQPFLQAWRSDAPAVVLYQPQFLYVSRENIYNFDSKTLNDAADRFANVNDWMIRTQNLPGS